MLSTYVGHARKFWSKYCKTTTAQSILELVGEIADQDFYHGDAETKIQLIALYLSELEKTGGTK